METNCARHGEDLSDFPPLLRSDLLAALRARVHVVALQRVFDGHLVQRLLSRDTAAFQVTKLFLLC